MYANKCGRKITKMSKRIYVTLNPNKDKDLVILEYLNSTYNESETIKSILYQIATKRCYEGDLESKRVESEINKEMQKGAESIKELHISTSHKDNNNEIDIDTDIRNLFG